MSPDSQLLIHEILVDTLRQADSIYEVGEGEQGVGDSAESLPPSYSDK